MPTPAAPPAPALPGVAGVRGSDPCPSAGEAIPPPLEPRPLIWILDDDERLCALLCERLAALAWDSGSFHEPRALEQALQQSSPSLLILDEMLPGRRGSELLAGLRQQGHAFPVLMLSALRSPHDRIAGLEAGAHDYLGKPFEFRELQLRIERLLQLSGCSEVSTPPAAACFRLAGLRFRMPDCELQTPGGEVSRLSRGDAALLLALCRRPGEVVGRQVLARASGSLVDASQSRSIDVRMGRLRKLLQGLVPEQGEVIRSCRGQGYCLLVPVSPLPES